MVAACCFLIAPAPKAEIVPLQNALVRKELQRPVDRGERNSAIDLVGAPMNLFADKRIPSRRQTFR